MEVSPHPNKRKHVGCSLRRPRRPRLEEPCRRAGCRPPWSGHTRDPRLQGGSPTGAPLGIGLGNRNSRFGALEGKPTGATHQDEVHHFEKGPRAGMNIQMTCSSGPNCCQHHPCICNLHDLQAMFFFSSDFQKSQDLLGLLPHDPAVHPSLKSNVATFQFPKKTSTTLRFLSAALTIALDSAAKYP